MAKKSETKKRTISPGYKPHASARCKLEHCMGCPKELINVETFDGKICKECFAVHEYRPQVAIDNQEKIDIKEEKVKKKTLTTSEEEIEKLIKVADKKEKKVIKNPAGEQQKMF